MARAEPVRLDGSHAPPVSAAAATYDASAADADAAAAEAADAEAAAAAAAPAEVAVAVAHDPPRTGSEPPARSSTPPEDLCCTFVQAANCHPTDCTICAQPMSPCTFSTLLVPPAGGEQRRPNRPAEHAAPSAMWTFATSPGPGSGLAGLSERLLLQSRAVRYFFLTFWPGIVPERLTFPT